jgi:hypothetical protein
MIEFGLTLDRVERYVYKLRKLAEDASADGTVILYG